ncbi:response regulator [Streptomyces sp. NPDC056149]|uniref:response regulator transcription factor n=1 Tax=unclassified Streptomyces TaxID=2593676 RepID=UPI00238168B2|nr:response regulator transcription factor [Streptomyces sp. WZ-12]
MTIRVAIVDDQAIIRSGLRMMLETSDDFEVVAEAVDGADALSQARAHRPDVALVDLRMPNIDGIAATRKLLELPEPPRVLVLSTYNTDEQVFEALSAGAHGFLLKDLRAEELFSALHVVMSGGRVFARDVLQNLVRRAARRMPVRVHGINAKVAALSDSERKVLALVGMGMTNEQIAKQLHLSGASVKTYVSRTLSKLGLENRTQAAVVAYTVGLIDSCADDVGRQTPL